MTKKKLEDTSLNKQNVDTSKDKKSDQKNECFQDNDCEMDNQIVLRDSAFDELNANKVNNVDKGNTKSKLKTLCATIKSDYKVNFATLKKPLSCFIMALTFVIMFFSMAIFNIDNAYTSVVAKQKYVYQNAFVQNGGFVGLEKKPLLTEKFTSNVISYVNRKEQLLNVDNKILIEIDVVYFDNTLPDGKMKISSAVANRLKEKNDEIIKNDKKNNVKEPSELYTDKIAVGEKYKIFGETFEIDDIIKTNYENDKKYNKLNSYEYDFVYLPQSYFEKLVPSLNKVVLRVADGEKFCPIEIILDKNITAGNVVATSDVFNFFDGKSKVVFERGVKSDIHFDYTSIVKSTEVGGKIWVGEDSYNYLKTVACNSFLAYDGQLSKKVLNSLDKADCGLTLNSDGYEKYSKNQLALPQLKEVEIMRIVGVVGCLIALGFLGYFGYVLSKKYFENKQNCDGAQTQGIVWYEGLLLTMIAIAFAFINFVVFWFVICYIYGVIVFANARVLMLLPIIFGIAVAFCVVACCFAHNILKQKKLKENIVEENN